MANANYILALKILIYFKFVQCNLIITKSMIRSPDDNLEKERISIVKNRTQDDQLYRIVTPHNFTRKYESDSVRYQESRSFADTNFGKDILSSSDEKGKFENFTVVFKNKDVNLNDSLSETNDNNITVSNNGLGSDNTGLENVGNSSIADNRNDIIENVVDIGEMNKKTERGRQQRSSLIGFNNKYWDDLRNMSYNYLQSSYTADVDSTSSSPDTNADVESTDGNLWDLLLTVYYCFWSDGFVKCISENLVGPLSKYPAEETENEGFLLNFTSGGSEEVTDNAERSGDLDETEGECVM